ncbi:SLOG family protein [Nocardia ninae]|uniref:YspA cpYpsA-related SLOG domain-containing protein n=1 Tax=Nocardia ninae NBRC 108245 TaxID=1210091 RepID=A0A511M7T6_9NOCA|nr:SLOG family protein [Nocardia ninae]GEM36713.1 hypothetical protein NN4_12320 [Nocardia ninae NBRC 108245]
MPTAMFSQPTFDRDGVRLELAVTISHTSPPTPDAPLSRGRRILITGSRSWTDRATIRAALAEVWSPDVVLVSGACPHGADVQCEACWQAWGGRIERHPADWDRLGRRAGFVRNEQMVRAGADLCMAFIRDNSPGATHTARLAQQAGIPTRIFRTADTPAMADHPRN